MGAVKGHISPASALVHFHSCIRGLEDSIWSKFWSLTKMPLPRNLHRNLPDREPTPPQSKSSTGKSGFVNSKAQDYDNTKDPVS